jgi:hypothetical protein
MESQLCGRPSAVIRGATLATAVFAGVLPQSLLTAFIVVLAHGVHNSGEGFAIATRCLRGLY